MVDEDIFSYQKVVDNSWEMLDDIIDQINSLDFKTFFSDSRGIVFCKWLTLLHAREVNSFSGITEKSFLKYKGRLQILEEIQRQVNLLRLGHKEGEGNEKRN